MPIADLGTTPPHGQSVTANSRDATWQGMLPDVVASPAGDGDELTTWYVPIEGREAWLAAAELGTESA